MFIELLAALKQRTKTQDTSNQRVDANITIYWVSSLVLIETIYLSFWTNHSEIGSKRLEKVQFVIVSV